MWIVNCLNVNGTNSFYKWHSHSDECSQIGNAGISHITVTFTKRRMLFFESLLQCYAETWRKQLRFNQQKGTISISNHRHFHTNISSCQCLAAPAPSASFPYHCGYIRISVIACVIDVGYNDTPSIYPIHLPISSISDVLVDFLYLWLPLMGQLKGVLTGLWNVTAFSLLFVCEIGG